MADPRPVARLSWGQTVVVAAGIAVCCAALVWWLEGFQRERLIAAFREQVARLPEFKGQVVGDA